METIRVAGRKYTDPDIISLIKATGSLVDPRSAVIHQARTLTANLKRFNAVPQNGIARMTILASIKGITVEAMNVERQQAEKRDALLVTTTTGQQILYNPKRPPGRVAFSIAHEIAHTFFPNSVKGARFRNICESSSKEANELERLCDLGGAELLMPIDEFRAATGGQYSLNNADALANLFGSSFEATVYRLATAHPGLAVSGLLRHRQRKDEERRARRLEQQETLFPSEIKPGVNAPPKYRRQSCYLSEKCTDDFTIRWNKSFDLASIVYQAGLNGQLHSSVEILPNEVGLRGRIEAIRAPYQRDDASGSFPDVFFFWTADTDI
jgi:Zn-dependent peptidase ImmA (M78 family)